MVNEYLLAWNRFIDVVRTEPARLEEMNELIAEANAKSRDYALEYNDALRALEECVSKINAELPDADSVRGEAIDAMLDARGLPRLSSWECWLDAVSFDMYTPEEHPDFTAQGPTTEQCRDRRLEIGPLTRVFELLADLKPKRADSEPLKTVQATPPEEHVGPSMVSVPEIELRALLGLLASHLPSRE